MIAIVDYKAGNLVSVQLAFQDLGIPVEITRDPEKVKASERIVFPGVGAAGAAMTHLDELRLRQSLVESFESGKPFLGICLGMQVLFDASEENNGTNCLGIIPGQVRRFQTGDPLCKIPQMGWNAVSVKQKHPIFEGIEDESEFYFVHSYYARPEDAAFTLGETEYADTAFTSVVGRGNLVATQFHPERSGRIGLQLLKNFAAWQPK